MACNASNIGYHNLNVRSVGYHPGIPRQPGPDNRLIASFSLTVDLAGLFPHINAVARKAELYDRPPMVRFVFRKVYWALYPLWCIAIPFNDRDHLRETVAECILFLNDIRDRRRAIVPSHRLFRSTSVLDVLKLVPGTNCRQCGYPTCMAFAAMVSRQRAVPEACPHISIPMNEQAVYPVYDVHGNLSTTVTIAIDHSQRAAAAVSGNRAGRFSDPGVNMAAGPASLPANTSLPSPLTGREISVLRIMGQGATNREISEILNISPHTVKSHVIHIFNKLGVNDRTQAAVWAARQAII